MLTKEEAINADRFHHIIFKNSDGTPVRARRNGKTQTWKTRPNEFRIPVKYGLKTCLNITHKTAHDWEVAND